MKVESDVISTGPWCPTNYLRWNRGVLEQKMRRRLKHYVTGSSAWTTYEFAWQPIPEFKE